MEFCVVRQGLQDIKEQICLRVREDSGRCNAAYAKRVVKTRIAQRQIVTAPQSSKPKLVSAGIYLSLMEDIMGKTNLFTVLATVITQFVVGYLWYGSYLFGDVLTSGGVHGMDFLKLDIISLLLIVLSSYGLTHVLGLLVKTTGTKDIGGGLKLGLTIGSFGIGFPIIMLLNLMGLSKIVLLVIFTHLVLVTILTSVIVIKLKKA